MDKNLIQNFEHVKVHRPSCSYSDKIKLINVTRDKSLKDQVLAHIGECSNCQQKWDEFTGEENRIRNFFVEVYPSQEEVKEMEETIVNKIVGLVFRGVETRQRNNIDTVKLAFKQAFSSRSLIIQLASILIFALAWYGFRVFTLG